jgi:hypothetical protein
VAAAVLAAPALTSALAIALTAWTLPRLAAR